MSPSCLIALGNELYGDDGIGPRLIQSIEEQALLTQVELFDSATNPWQILPLINEDTKTLVFIDAVKMNRQPGQWQWIDLNSFFEPGKENQMPQFLFLAEQNVHEFNVLSILKLTKESQMLNSLSQCYLLAIEPEQMDFGQTISPSLIKNYSQYLATIIDFFK